MAHGTCVNGTQNKMCVRSGRIVGGWRMPRPPLPMTGAPRLFPPQLLPQHATALALLHIRAGNQTCSVHTSTMPRHVIKSVLVGTHSHGTSANGTPLKVVAIGINPALSPQLKTTIFNGNCSHAVRRHAWTRWMPFCKLLIRQHSRNTFTP